jgi:hypothetical protein
MGAPPGLAPEGNTSQSISPKQTTVWSVINTFYAGCRQLHQVVRRAILHLKITKKSTLLF